MGIDHCWHIDGIPEENEYRCCFCGVLRRHILNRNPPEGHGMYHPQTKVESQYVYLAGGGRAYIEPPCNNHLLK